MEVGHAHTQAYSFLFESFVIDLGLKYDCYSEGTVPSRLMLFSAELNSSDDLDHFAP